jgi:aminomethyltransferase
VSGRQTPLYGRHEALGAKFADFSGWDMPIEYAGGGVLKEHAAVREAVGLFDVSHLGTALVRGPGAREHVNGVLSNDLGRIGPGKAQYTMLLDDHGGVVDDLIVYLRADDDLLLVPNAANAAAVVARIARDAPDTVEVTDVHADFAVLAVQGPRADEVMAAVGLPTGLDYMAFADVDPDLGVDTVVCRTGYTGERGYEIVLPADAAPALWDRLVPAVEAAGGRVAGLGARDTLRTEMGYPLHGHELSAEISPVQARSGWAVGWKKASFVGRDAVVAEKENGPRRLLRGLRVEGRGVPRDGMTVRDADGTAVGVVTSGTFSPTLGGGIALALVDTAAGVEDGAALTVEVRGRQLPVVVLTPPFVESHVR